MGNLNVFEGFYSVPLTESSAVSKKWAKLMSCGDSTSPGNLYALQDDLSSMPFYNADGNIAGIVLGMFNPGSSSKKSPFTEFKLSNGTSFWGVQANFRDPAKICQSGSSNNVKVGDRLWFTNGNHNDYYEAPLYQNKSTLEGAGWVTGACFWQMGYHWWRYISADADCNGLY